MCNNQWWGMDELGAGNADEGNPLGHPWLWVSRHPISGLFSSHLGRSQAAPAVFQQNFSRYPDL